MQQVSVIAILMISCVSPAMADETTGFGFIVNRVERTLQAELPGTLERLFVEEGDLVEAGQILATMRSADLARRIQRATAQVELSHIDRQIAEARVKVYDGRPTSQTAARSDTQNRNVDQDQLEMNRLNAELELQRAKAANEATQKFRVLLQKQLERLRVRAPFDGKISGVHAKAGDVFAHSGSPLLTVCRPDELAAHVRFPAKATNLLSQDRPNGGGPLVTLQIEALDMSIEGQVTRVSPSVDPSSQTLQTTVQFDNKKLSLLRPGMKVTAEIRSSDGR